MVSDTIVTYKLFNYKKGKLYPLYVNADKHLPLGEWINAECGELLPSGKVKAKLGNGLSFRPGFHSQENYAVALHIGKKANPKDVKPSFRPKNQVWCKCLIHDDGGKWQERANANGKTPRDKCLKEIPVGGFYRYKTNPNMFGEWCISGELFIEKILSDEEVKEINDKFGVSDLPREV
jgi:hypothetical protein